MSTRHSPAAARTTSKAIAFNQETERTTKTLAGNVADVRTAIRIEAQREGETGPVELRAKELRTQREQCTSALSGDIRLLAEEDTQFCEVLV